MDTKLLSKVPTWNGDEDQWFEWSFAFRAYCQLPTEEEEHAQVFDA